jgi:hypothetical protein
MDIKSNSPINPNKAFHKAINDKEKLYCPILTNLKPPGYIFQVLVLNFYGAAHQNVRNFISELKSFLASPHHTAFNARNFISYATHRLPIWHRSDDQSRKSSF